MGRRWGISAAGGLSVMVLALGVLAPAARATPAAGSLKLTLNRVFSVAGQPVTVPHRAVAIRGTVRPYVPWQSVTVTAYLRGRLIQRRQVVVHGSPGASSGSFADTVTSPGVGLVRVAVTRASTAQLGALKATTKFSALDDSVGFGATGLFVVLVQRRLAAMRFYIRQTGVYDQGTGWAIDAYHRLLHWGTAQTLDRSTVFALLSGRSSFPVRYPRDGRHAEGNLGLQLLALINRGRVLALYPISSGKPSTPTVLGRYRVYLKRPGYLPDGMYYSSFFYRGYAIHGYDPAPDYPASHGCMRVPIADAVSIYNWLRIGDGVDVYR